MTTAPPVRRLATMVGEAVRAGDGVLIARRLRDGFAAIDEAGLAARQHGETIARRRAAFADAALVKLIDGASEAVPNVAARTSVCAIGGYGRRLLAPRSDLDVLFLHSFRDPDKIRPLIDFVLYPLWDAGISVGHAVHTPASATALAREDIAMRTSFLDARHIVGDFDVFQKYTERYDRLRRRTAVAFVRSKYAEQESRHSEEDQSRYLAEPDLKEGKGGLRDLQTMRWAARYVYGDEIDAPYAEHGLLTPVDLEAFLKAERFLWSVRVYRHLVSSRLGDDLPFDLQPELADRLGYAERRGATPAERLMKHVLLNAMEVGRLTRLFWAGLEDQLGASLTGSRRSPRATTPRNLLRDEVSSEVNVSLRRGRLDFADVTGARETPLDWLRLFRAHAKRPDLTISPYALAVISDGVGGLDAAFRKDPFTATLFTAILETGRDPAQTLGRLTETGLLAKILPALGKVVGRVEYGLYRRYALHEQIFRALGVLRGVRAGILKAAHPTACEILEVSEDRRAFHLLVLLYEARLSLSAPTGRDTERLVRRLAANLGASPASAQAIAFVAARHRLMIDVAERRNLSDYVSIEHFAREIEAPERLDLLYVLSICHLRVVGAGAWDAWTSRQLEDLYHAARAVFSAGRAGFDAWLAARADGARNVLRQSLADWPADERTRFVGGLSDAATRSLDAGQLLRLANIWRERAGALARVVAHADLHDGVLDLMVSGPDRPGLLADLAGAAARSRLTVKRVLALTGPDGDAFDLFTLAAADGGRLERGERIDEIVARFSAAGEGRLARPTAFPPHLGDKRPLFDVPAAVRLYDDASQSCLVVEAEGRDRPALLFRLAAALEEIGVDVKSAHIATYAERAVDAFYLQDAPGYKITNPRRLQSIERRLMNVLSAPD